MSPATRTGANTAAGPSPPPAPSRCPHGRPTGHPTGHPCPHCIGTPAPPKMPRELMRRICEHGVPIDPNVICDACTELTPAPSEVLQSFRSDFESGRSDETCATVFEQLCEYVETLHEEIRRLRGEP